MVEADFIERSRRSKSRNVAADIVLFAIRAHHHRQCVPANQRLDPPLQFLVAWEKRLQPQRNRIRVRRICRKRQINSIHRRVRAQPFQNLTRHIRTARLQHGVQRLKPLLNLYILHMMWLGIRLIVHFRPCLLRFFAKLGMCRRHTLHPEFQSIFNVLEYYAARPSARRNHDSGVTYSAPRRRSKILRHKYKIPPTTKPGSHTQSISLQITANPRGEKNAAPIGDTTIGLHGKKYRVALKGEKNAMPSPPFVIASSTPWEAVIKKKRMLWPIFDVSEIFSVRLPSNQFPTTIPATAADKIECVIPRCPHKSPYRTPNPNPITSTSGNAEHTSAAVQNRQSLRNRSAAACPNAAPTRKCVGTLG